MYAAVLMFANIEQAVHSFCGIAHLPQMGSFNL